MKLVLRGHNERYTVEQSLMNLLPGELPVYGDVGSRHSEASEVPAPGQT